MARQITQFLALTLAAYRIIRFITADTLPPMAALRRIILTGHDRARSWREGIVCPWCVGVYVCLATVWIANVWIPVRYPWLQALAMMTLTGLIAGNLDDA